MRAGGACACMCEWGGRSCPLSTFPLRVVGAHLWHTPCPGAPPGLHAFLLPSLPFPFLVFVRPSPLFIVVCLLSPHHPLCLLLCHHPLSLPLSKSFSCSVLLPISSSRCAWGVEKFRQKLYSTCKIKKRMVQIKPGKARTYF